MVKIKLSNSFMIERRITMGLMSFKIKYLDYVLTPRPRSRFLSPLIYISMYHSFGCLLSNFGFHRTNFDVGAMNFVASNGKVSFYYNRKLHLPFTKVDLSNFNFKIQKKLLEKHIEEMEKEPETRSGPWGI